MRDFEDNVSLGVILVGGAIMAGLLFGASKEKKRRLAIPVSFSEGLDADVFSLLCNKEASSIKRLSSIEVDDLSVRCSVKSNSGLSNWQFTADFYDYGKLTGNYWLSSENDESILPKVFLDRVKREIQSIFLEYPISTLEPSMNLIGKNISDVKVHFRDVGFLNVSILSKKKGILDVLKKNGTVFRISINGVTEFTKEDRFSKLDLVQIYYFQENICK
jgi:hypothetical protein